MWVVLGESNKWVSCPCRALGEKYLRWAWGSVCDGCWTRRCPRRGRPTCTCHPRSSPHWGPWHQAPCLPTLALISGRSHPRVQGSPCLSSSASQHTSWPWLLRIIQGFLLLYPRFARWCHSEFPPSPPLSTLSLCISLLFFHVWDYYNHSVFSWFLYL